MVLKYPITLKQVPAAPLLYLSYVDRDEDTQLGPSSGRTAKKLVRRLFGCFSASNSTDILAYAAQSDSSGKLFISPSPDDSHKLARPNTIVFVDNDPHPGMGR
jgi:hypothetical protein